MSLISPFPQNSIIKIYSGINWDNTYNDIVLFNDSSARQNYLNTHLVDTYTNCSIVKSGKSIKITEQLNKLLPANYLSFQNPSQLGEPDKNFYAFITGINYININTVEIEYEIDWVQSYLFDIVFESCFVEREHVNDDTPGKHTIPEGLEVGEYVSDGVTHKIYNTGILIWEADYENGTVVGNIATMLKGTTWGKSFLGAALDYLSHLKETPELVPLITMCPLSMFTETAGGSPKIMSPDTINGPKVDKIFRLNDDEYVAVNNKLMTSPYKFITLDNFGGQVEQYQYENFNDMTPTFQVTGTPLPRPVMMCSPINYKNSQEGYGVTGGFTQQAVIFDQFPQVGWTSDTYRFYMGQYVSQAVATLGSMLTVGVSAASGNIPGVLIGGGALASNAMSNVLFVEQEKVKQLHSRQYNSGTGEGAMEALNDNIGFRITQFAVRPEIAKIIDQYFTRYGYRVNTVKVPNTTGRARFNYVKTRNARVGGTIPIDTRVIIEKAMDNGVTFWHTGDINRNSSEDNPIIESGE